MNGALTTLGGLLAAFLVRARLLAAEEQPVPADDPTRDPNWCWMHNMLWPACADRH